MICTTVREGHDCPFMKAQGCTYKNGSCLEVVEQCGDCTRKAEFPSGWYCSACPEPDLKWKNGRCNLTTVKVVEGGGKKAKINPLKASKRGSR